MAVELAGLSIHVLVVLLPGVVGMLVVLAMTFLDRPPGTLFLLYSLLLGLGAYAVYAVVLGAMGTLLGVPAVVGFFKFLRTGSVAIDPLEVAAVTGVGTALGVALSVVIDRGIVHAVAFALGITRRFHEETLWGYVFNRVGGPWVTVRDLEHDLVYEGWVAAYSDGVDPNELLLRNARVSRNSTGDPLYDVAGLFVSRSSGRVLVEFRSWPFPATLKDAEVPTPGDG